MLGPRLEEREYVHLFTESLGGAGRVTEPGDQRPSWDRQLLHLDTESVDGLGDPEMSRVLGSVAGRQLFGKCRLRRQKMKRVIWSSVLLLVVGGAYALGADLYGPDPMDSGAGWGANSTADVAITFGYDYSADGIPEAPNSVGGAPTTGMKAEANLSAEASNFFTAYPIGQNFTGTHQLRFDAWMNFSIADYNAGGVGTTEFLGGGLGYDGVTMDVASGAQAICTGDGGSGSDYRAFKDGFFIAAADMAAGTRQGSDPYYADFFPPVSPPQDQEQDLGDSIAGSPAFQWVTWIFTNVDGIVTVDLQKPDLSTLRIVTIDCLDTSDGSSGCSYEGNISLFYADFFSSVSPSPELTFGLFDNVYVTDVPEPASLLLLVVGGLLARRR